MPLALLALLIGAWASVRAVIWDSPLTYSSHALAANETTAEKGRADFIPQTRSDRSFPAPQSVAYPYPAYPAPVYYGHRVINAGHGYWQGPYPQGSAPSPSVPIAAPHNRAGQVSGGRFMLAPETSGTDAKFIVGPSAFRGAGSRFGGFEARKSKRELKLRRTGQVARLPQGAGIPVNGETKTDRWLLDVFGFYRQGSSALSIPQGRSPIYGASQLAANFQWRAKPSSSHDPRLYARAYHASVTGGESELAAGISARPIGRFPVRLYGELRATQSPALFDQGVEAELNFRPAAYAVTELAPLKLPLGLSLEAYGAAGYVAGNSSTYFVDGQAAATRRLIRIGKASGPNATVSIGGGIWGGAQKDAQRLDVGPTLRFDVDIGDMPARVSVDYREQVAGDAEPDSGVAATVSTRF